MVLDEPGDGFGFAGVEAHMRAQPPRDPGACFRVVLRPALGDVVEQHRHIEHVARPPQARHQRVRQRMNGFRVALLDLRQDAHTTDQVLVDGVVVIHVELHHRHDGFEFRDESGQHAKFVHAPQRTFRIAVFQQQIHEDANRFGIRANRVVDQIQIGRDNPHGVRVDQDPGAQCFFKQAQDIQRIGDEFRFVLDRQPAMMIDEARLQFAPFAEQSAEERGRADMLRLERGQEYAGQFTHSRRVTEIILHEILDAAPGARIGITHSAGDLDLHVERQHIDGPSRNQMQMTAHRPKEILGLPEGQMLVAGEYAHRHQLDGAVDMVDIFGDPVKRLQVAEAPLSLLDIGFQNVALPALTLMAGRAFFQLGFDELRNGLFEKLGPQPVAQFMCQRGMTSDQPMLDQRGADRHVACTQAQAIVDRADGMADLQFQIPQHIQHGFDHALGPGRDLVGCQKQQVDIGSRCHFGPAITPNRQNGQPLRFRGSVL